MVRCPRKPAAAREEGVIGDVGDGSGRLEKLKGASRGDGGATGAVSWGMASDARRGCGNGAAKLVGLVVFPARK